MKGMPADIRRAAVEAYHKAKHGDSIEPIARAILAERERCADLAYVEAVKHCSARDGMTFIGHPVGHSISAAILRGTE